MEFDGQAEAFRALGYELAALSVDVPQRSVGLRAQLGLRLPLLCDVTREAVQTWGLYNRRERGGIAVPATVVVDAGGVLRFSVQEGMARRLRASDLLAWLGQRGSAPRPRGFWPGARAWWRALLH